MSLADRLGQAADVAYAFEDLKYAIEGAGESRGYDQYYPELDMELPPPNPTGAGSAAPIATPQQQIVAGVENKTIYLILAGVFLVFMKKGF